MEILFIFFPIQTRSEPPISSSITFSNFFARLQHIEMCWCKYGICVRAWMKTMNRIGCGIESQPPQLRQAAKTLVTLVSQRNSKWRRSIALKTHFVTLISSKKKHIPVLIWIDHRNCFASNKSCWSATQKRDLYIQSAESEAELGIDCEWATAWIHANAVQWLVSNDHMHAHCSKLSVWVVCLWWLMNLLFVVGFFCSAHSAHSEKKLIMNRLTRFFANETRRIIAELKSIEWCCIRIAWSNYFAIAQLGNMFDVFVGPWRYSICWRQHHIYLPLLRRKTKRWKNGLNRTKPSSSLCSRKQIRNE